MDINEDKFVPIFHDDWNHPVLTLFAEGKFTKKAAWVDLNIVCKNNKGCVSHTILARRWGWCRGKVGRFLQDLVHVDMISTKSSRGRNGHTVVVIKQPNERNEFMAKEARETQKRREKAECLKQLKESIKNLKRYLQDPDSQKALELREQASRLRTI